MNVKKKISLLICACVLAVGFPALIHAGAGEDVSKRVEVSDFKFTDGDGTPIDSLTGNMTIKASCRIERTEIGDGAQDYTFVLMTYKGGKLKSIKTQKGSVSAGVPTTPSVSEILEADTSEYRIMAYLWSDLFYMDLLSSPAYFGSGECGLSDIRINGKSIGSLKTGVLEYDYEVLYRESDVPGQIDVTPKDLTSKIEITNMDSFPGDVTIKSTSHNGEHEKTYVVHMKTAPPKKAEAIPTKLASKVYYVETISVIDLPSTNPALAALRANADHSAGGSNQIIFLKFSLPKLPQNAVVKSARLKFWAYAGTASQNELEAFVCTDDNWDTDPKYSAKGYPPYKTDETLSTAPILVNSTSIQEFEMDLKPAIVGERLDFVKDSETPDMSIALRKSYDPNSTAVYVYVNIKDAIPIIELEYYE